MTYVSKEAAKALKEIGFDLRATWHYVVHREKPLHYAVEENHNLIKDYFSAPNHLEAADWLSEKYDIYILFGRNYTDCCPPQSPDIEFVDVDGHRDLAIIEACKIIKERKSPPPAEG